MKNQMRSALCALSLGAAAAQGQVYNNSTINQDIIYFGSPNTATYGQTFTAPNSVLDDWTFYLENNTPDGANGAGNAQNFEFFVMGWNGSMATGPVLYQSAEQNIPFNANAAGFTPFTVAPDVSLTPGNQYVMFINESALNVGVPGEVTQGGNSTSPLGGSFVYLNNGDDFSQVTSGSWSPWTTPDTAYNAVFSGGNSVPDAGSSMLLMSLGLGGIAAMRRRFTKA
jgi:hypothetical protein